MRTNSNTAQVHNFFLEYKIIADKKYKNIKHCIEAATGSIPKGLQWHEPSEKRIKNIDKPEYKGSHQASIHSEMAAKISLLNCTFALPNR